MQAGDPCTTADGRSGYLLASGDKFVCEVPGPSGPESVQAFATAGISPSIETATEPAAPTIIGAPFAKPAEPTVADVQAIVAALTTLKEALRPFFR